MPLVDISELHKQAMDDKINKGIPILKSLAKWGIPKSTYYKKIGDNGEEKWRDMSEGQMIVKVKQQRRLVNVKKDSQEFKGMSGDGIPDTDEDSDPLLQEIDLKLDNFKNKYLKKYAQYRNEQDS